MVTCVRIPVTLPKDRDPTKYILKEIISTFLQEWSIADPETLITRHDVGHTGAHWFVERPNSLATKPGSEPSEVFIKFHKDEETGVEALQHLVSTKDVEADLVRQFGETNYGPRMIGFFEMQDGMRGRIDEHIDSRTLEPGDVEDENIRADIARAHAMFHTMKGVALTKNPVNSYYEAISSGIKKYHKMEKLKRLAKEGGVDIDGLVDYDFPSKLGQVVNRMQLIRAKEGWCIHDVQFGNVLVKERPKNGESKISLIDFEFVFRNYRGFDIGGHWFQKMSRWFDEVDKIVDCRPYTDEEKQHFCEVYAKSWNEVTGDNDTGEQIFAEASLGYLLALTFDIHFMLMAMDEDDNNDLLDALGLKKLFNEFVGQYSQLGLEVDS